MNKIPWSYRFYRWTWNGLDLLFPPVCGGCGRSGSRWCAECRGRVSRIRKPFCEKCGIPTRGSEICEKCKSNPPAYRALRSWAVFDSPVQNALHAIKYRRNIGLADALAADLVEFVRALQWTADLLIPAPLGKARLKERGYNQVGLVARPLAYELGIEYAPNGLRKTRETRSQVGLSAAERQANVAQAYQADPSAVKRKSILLMDDVATTGSTLASCTAALMSAGAAEVQALTIARALAHHGLNRV
ncbi:MAG: ComF family protein [Anaerolineales bacterium]|nr:ComF family protein [Anaerolineales bacterium]